MRASGILLPISSLPSPYGIGCFSKCAYDFVDFLCEAGQSYWQILPLGPTSYGDSPYQSFSTFAGNPYFIDLEELVEEGLLTKEECENSNYGDNAQYVEYGIIYEERFRLLKIAFAMFDLNDKNYQKFVEENKSWIEDYSLYMAIKKSFDDKSFSDWDEDIKLRKPEILEKYNEEFKVQKEFYKFLQFKFISQWIKLKKYANKKGIKIIGDIPIYVAFDSADVWARPELFQFDEDLNPIRVAGCPPDGFTEDGQLWGNPLYNWDKLKQDGYSFWVKRVKSASLMYDVVRIDHFRAFEAYYSIPYGELTARNGVWKKGPNYDLFKVIKDELGDVNIIAEDLGFLTPEVYKLLDDCGYPGMKVLQFAFSPQKSDSEYLPHNYKKNCIAYTGTHDNQTSLSWFLGLDKKTKNHVLRYLGGSKPETIVHNMIKSLYASVSNTVIIPMQDYLLLDDTARINEPSTMGENWTFRITKDALNKKLSKNIKKLTKIYYR